MNVSIDFIGNMPQRGILLNGDDNNIKYISSGVWSIRDRIISDDKIKIGERDFTYGQKADKRAESFPLSIFNIKKVNDEEKSNVPGIKNQEATLRLEDKELCRFPAQNKYVVPPSGDNDGSGIVVIWNENEIDTTDLPIPGPQKTDCYIWLVEENLPNIRTLKEMSDSNVIIVFKAESLRDYGLNISRGLSWESTARETVQQFNKDKLKSIKEYAALIIVRFGLEGALVIHKGKGKTETKHTLYYHTTALEGDTLYSHSGSVPEANEVYAALIVNDVINGFLYFKPEDSLDFTKIIPQIKDNISQYICCSIFTHVNGYYERFLTNKTDADAGADTGNTGHGIVDSLNELTGRDVIALMKKRIKKIDVKEKWLGLSIADRFGIKNINRSYYWFEENIDRLINVVHNGTISSLIECPMLKIGNLQSIDLAEIEAYSAIKKLIRNYCETRPHSRPISIAVHGKPGSGKSFGIKEIATNILGSKVTFLEYNLSQFDENNPSSLLIVFHDIQDSTMQGKIPIVFIDEYDTNDMKWVKHFLMPMQDGEFYEHNDRRKLGDCIFVFAGSSFDTLKQLSEKSLDPKSENYDYYKTAKVPDFLSRIKGYVDTLSIDADETEYYKRGYFFKRIILLSSKIKKLEKSTNKKIEVGRDMLRAFLFTKKYEHGVRSMEAILEMSVFANNSSDRIRIRNSDLPPSNQLALHVNAIDFKNLMDDRLNIEKLKEYISKKLAESEGLEWDVLQDSEKVGYYDKAKGEIDFLVNDLDLSIGYCTEEMRVPEAIRDEQLLLVANLDSKLKKLTKRQYNIMVANSDYDMENYDSMEYVFHADIKKRIAPFCIGDRNNTEFYLWDYMENDDAKKTDEDNGEADSGGADESGAH